MGKPRTPSPEREANRRLLQEANARIKGHVSSRTRRRRANKPKVVSSLDGHEDVNALGDLNNNYPEETKQ